MSVIFNKVVDDEILLCHCCRQYFDTKNVNMYKITYYSNVNTNSKSLYCENCRSHPGYNDCPNKKTF